LEVESLYRVHNNGTTDCTKESSPVSYYHKTTVGIVLPQNHWLYHITTKPLCAK